MTHITTPPAIAELEWAATPTGWTALANPGFWDLYNIDRPAFRSVGIRAEPVNPGSGYNVIFDPRGTSQEQLSAAIARQRERYQFLEMSKSDQERETERLNRERRAEQAIRDAERLAAREAHDAQLRQKAHDRAVALLAEWGEFAVRKAMLAELAAKPIAELTWHEINAIDKAHHDTTIKAGRKLRDAAKASGGVSWPDDVVEDAVDHLTGADGDHATSRNTKGWSRADSSTGHWCSAMMTTDRVVALKVARTILGKYSKQLVEAGAIDPVVELKEEAA